MNFLDEAFSPFITPNAPTNQKDFAFGQIFKAPMYYLHQRLEIWRPEEIDQKQHRAKNFNITTSLADAFKRSLPYSYPPLATNEEFIALKAKRRPVILLQPPDPVLQEVKAVSNGMKLVRHLCIVAPAFSLENAVGDRKVPPEFIARVRQLEYPQFQFLPKGGPITVDSLVRLDEAQSVAIQHLEHTGYSLSDDALAVFRSQVSFFMGVADGGDFAGWRNLLAED
jgi:hypothetical protein